jgi:hypothetical protein
MQPSIKPVLFVAEARALRRGVPFEWPIYRHYDGLRTAPYGAVESGGVVFPGLRPLARTSSWAIFDDFFRKRERMPQGLKAAGFCGE